MVPSITLTARPDGEYDVIVDVEGERIAYRVAVPASLAAEVGHPGADPTELVRQSFVFLLDATLAGATKSNYSSADQQEEHCKL